MNLQRFLRLVLSACVCLSVLCLNSRYAHAEQSDENENDKIVIDLSNSSFLDPSQPSVLSDDIDYVYPSDVYLFSCAYAPIDSAGNYGSFIWKDFVTDSVQLTVNQSYAFRIYHYLNTDIEPGTYDIVLTLGVPPGFSLSSSKILFQTRSFTDYASVWYSSSSQAYTAGRVIDNYEQSPYYTITWKDVVIDTDAGGIRLDLHGVNSNGGYTTIFPSSFELSKEDKKIGLLNGIIEIVRNIFTGITNLPSNIANSIKGFFDNIVNSLVNLMNVLKNAIVDLGNFLIDGIKNLFVPSSEDLQIYFDNWKALLSDRFGALYEVFDIIVGYFEQFTSVSGNSTIVFPSVSIPLAGAVFEFGGWSVSLIPEGFEVVFSALRLMISIICTIAFVNALRRRYDKVVEK